jgi:hypothetical protein
LQSLWSAEDQYHGVDGPDFLYATLDTAACAAFIKESRMNFGSASQLHRKSGGQQSNFTKTTR